MTTEELLSLAASKIGLGAMVSSARLCLDDAIKLISRGDDYHARQRALRSLAYSVGVFNPDMQRAAAAVNQELK